MQITEDSQLYKLIGERLTKRPKVLLKTIYSTYHSNQLLLTKLNIPLPKIHSSMHQERKGASPHMYSSSSFLTFSAQKKIFSNKKYSQVAKFLPNYVSGKLVISLSVIGLALFYFITVYHEVFTYNLCTNANV